jgi:uncharacterized RDD family membrane protein YckC
MRMNVQEDVTLADRLLQHLETHRSDAPEGFTEAELMEVWTDIRLLELRSAASRLAAEGRVRRVATGGGTDRIVLVDSDGTPTLGVSATRAERMVAPDSPARAAAQAIPTPRRLAPLASVTVGPATELVDEEARGFGIRAIAYLIDLLTCYLTTFVSAIVVLFLVAIAFGLVSGFTGRRVDFVQGATSDAALPGAFVLILLYFVLFESLTGATVGKAVLGLRVVKADGRACGIGSAIVRALFRFIDSLFFTLVAFVSMHEYPHQRVGDRVARTLVVNRKSAFIRRRRAWWGWLIAGALFLAVLTIYGIVLVLPYFRWAPAS